jgi:hypothetical protein
MEQRHTDDSDVPHVAMPPRRIRAADSREPESRHLIHPSAKAGDFQSLSSIHQIPTLCVSARTSVHHVQTVDGNYHLQSHVRVVPQDDPVRRAAPAHNDRPLAA